MTPLENALYVVATPIGNLRDITLRALDVLTQADVVAAEDTRNSAHLLAQHHIRAKQLVAVHQHNERGSAERMLGWLRSGQSVAFISDAGTPAVSDPGAILVQAVRAAGFRVIPVPGPSAAVAALSASGLLSPHFRFHGFLPNKAAARRSELQTLQAENGTVVFYEAPHRIVECVDDMRSVCGDERQVVLAREISKLFETFFAGTLAEAAAWLQADSNQQRGEFVVLLSAAPPAEGLSDSARRTLQLLLADLPLKQAVQLAANISGEPRNTLYQLALQLKQADAE